ncbi:MAG: hypothetical protein QN181_10590 [Armatimonadota bacterium]|nr:hypothetical protein [Armatimonadota bacterium]
MRRWDLIGHRRYLYLASLLIVLLAGAALAGNALSGRPPLNWGVDFTGGTLLLLRFEDRTVTTGKVRSVLAPLRLGEAVIQQTPGILSANSPWSKSAR